MLPSVCFQGLSVFRLRKVTAYGLFNGLSANKRVLPRKLVDTVCWACLDLRLVFVALDDLFVMLNNLFLLLNGLFAMLINLFVGLLLLF